MPVWFLIRVMRLHRRTGRLYIAQSQRWSLENLVDDSVDVSDVHHAVAIDIAGGGCTARQDDIDQGVDVSDVNSTVGVDVTGIHVVDIIQDEVIDVGRSRAATGHGDAEGGRLCGFRVKVPACDELALLGHLDSVLLLDGVDEIKREYRDSILDWIDELRKKYPNYSATLYQ